MAYDTPSVPPARAASATVAHRPHATTGHAARLIGCAATLALLAGCASPLAKRDQSGELKRSIIDGLRSELAEPTARPEAVTPPRTIGLDGYPEPLVRDIDSRLDELNQMAGPGAYSYEAEDLPLGADLLGQAQSVVGISLEQAIRLAVENNLELRFARLEPIISEMQTIQAEAAFDWIFFTSLQYTEIDQQIQDRATSGVNLSAEFNQNQETAWTLGVRRQLPTGAELQLQQIYTYGDSDQGNFILSPNPSHTLNFALQFDQPLLRGFGRDVGLAQVRLNRNAERDSIAELRGELISTVLETERAYWQLAQAYRDLLILRRLQERGEEVFDRVYQRRLIDAAPPQIFSALSRVEDRKGNVIAAQNVLRRRSDQLKRLLNDPSLPMSGEALLIPLDGPADEAVSYSVLDAYTTALQNRPEIDRAILSIDSATIRRQVAENNTLPQLDLRTQVRLNALEDDIRNAYDTALEARFIDLVVGLFFEQPIGNRGAEALARQRLVEREQAMISLRNTVQGIALEIRSQLDNMVTNYRLIEQRRIARLAAAETLRALIVQNETIQGFSIERLEVELNRQEGLAQAERAEVEALVNYQISIAELNAATGTNLERNGIEFEVGNGSERD